MRKLRVLVRLQVEECKPGDQFDREMMEDAAVEAVENVMRHATGAGFPHTYEKELSVCFVDAVLYEEYPDEDEQEEQQP
jgi:hypothetical protein